MRSSPPFFSTKSIRAPYMDKHGLSRRLNKLLLQHALSLDALPQQTQKVTGDTWAWKEAVQQLQVPETCTTPLWGGSCLGSPNGSANTSANCDLMPSSCWVSVKAMSGPASEVDAPQSAEAAQDDVLNVSVAKPFETSVWGTTAVLTITIKLSQPWRLARLHCEVSNSRFSTGSLAEAATGAGGSLKVWV